MPAAASGPASSKALSGPRVELGCGPEASWITLAPGRLRERGRKRDRRSELVQKGASAERWARRLLSRECRSEHLRCCFPTIPEAAPAERRTARTRALASGEGDVVEARGDGPPTEGMQVAGGEIDRGEIVEELEATVVEVGG